MINHARKAVSQSLQWGWVLTRYAGYGFLSFLIDILGFGIIYAFLRDPFFSILLGRIVSGSFNFYFNKYLVYRSLSRLVIQREALYYGMLATVIFILSYFSIREMTMYFHVPVLAAKILVDVVLFFINFLVQSYLFKGEIYARKAMDWPLDRAIFFLRTRRYQGTDR